MRPTAPARRSLLVPVALLALLGAGLAFWALPSDAPAPAADEPVAHAPSPGGAAQASNVISSPPPSPPGEVAPPGLEPPPSPPEGEPVRKARPERLPIEVQTELDKRAAGVELLDQTIARLQGELQLAEGAGDVEGSHRLRVRLQRLAETRELRLDEYEALEAEATAAASAEGEASP